MSWIDDNKGRGPWEFTEQSDKLHYNEGNLISDHDDPTWRIDHLSFSDKPITPTHHPWCGYWHKGYGPLECNCVDITIGYTTLQMSIDEIQTLDVQNPVSGCTYNWEITSGGGSLSSSTGVSVNYTAPSSNANCAGSPTIQLSCGGQVCDSISIAINEWTGGEIAYWIWSECEYIHPYGWCTLKHGWDCDNYSDGTVYASHCYNTKAQCEAGGLPGTLVDVRTQAMKDGGCCPEGLL